MLKLKSALLHIRIEFISITGMKIWLMPTPKIFRKNKNWHTPDHDLIHLWVDDPLNQIRIVEESISTIKSPAPHVTHDYHALEKGLMVKLFYDDIESYEILEKNAEQAIYSNKTYLGSIDAVIRLKVIFSARKNTGKIDLFEYQQPSENFLADSVTKDVLIPHIYTILCEFKPELGSVSGLMQQIHAYEEILKKKYVRLIPVVITFDDNSNYDQLLRNEGIRRIFRPNKDECTSTYLNKKI